MKIGIHIYILAGLVWSAIACNKSNGDVDPDTPPELPVKVWTTSGNEVNLLYNKTIDYAAGFDERFPEITITPAETLQVVDGFGYTLTGGSAMLLNQMEDNARMELLKEFLETAAILSM